MKKNRKKNITEQRAWRFTVISMTVVLLTLAGGVYLKQTRNKPLDTASLSASVDRLSGWFAMHRGRLNEKISKVKQIAASNAEQPIHYEFYSELPKMNVPVSAKRPTETR